MGIMLVVGTFGECLVSRRRVGQMLHSYDTSTCLEFISSHRNLDLSHKDLLFRHRDGLL